MRRVLILGGGFGGLAAARRLRQRLAPSDEIVLVDRRAHFMVGFRKTWALVGQDTLEAGRRPLANLAHQDVQWIHGSITALDPKARAAEVDGRRIEADALVVALGAELTPERVPGFRDHALNLYDADDIPRAADALRTFQGGRVLVGIFGAPYKCPPAPYEMALLIRSFFRSRGLSPALEVFTPQPMSLPVLGQAGCDLIEGRLADNGITFLPNHKATVVEAGEVVFGTGRRAFDLLLGVPPHRCPEVVVRGGLAGEADWLRVNPRTMETAFEGVYGVGDLVEIPMPDGKPLPKAGVFAEAMGETTADRIADGFAGREPAATFAGEGGCFLEVGNGEAMMVRGRFLAEPAPEIELTEPSRDYFAQKQAFETERLTAWLA